MFFCVGRLTSELGVSYFMTSDQRLIGKFARHHDPQIPSQQHHNLISSLIEIHTLHIRYVSLDTHTGTLIMKWISYLLFDSLR